MTAERPALQPSRSSSRFATPVLVLVGVTMSAAAFLGLVGVLAARRLGRLDAVDLGRAYAGASVAIAGSALLGGLLVAVLRPVALAERDRAPAPAT